MSRSKNKRLGHPPDIGTLVTWTNQKPVLQWTFILPQKKSFPVNFENVWGYGRLFSYSIENSSSKRIKQEGMEQDEKVDVLSYNVGGLKPNLHDSPDKQLAPLGLFPDIQAFVLPMSPGPIAGQFVKERQTMNVYTKAAKYEGLRINCIDQEYNDVTVTDVTQSASPTCPQ